MNRIERENKKMKIGKSKSGMIDHTDLLVALKITEIDKLERQKKIINKNKQQNKSILTKIYNAILNLIGE